MKKIDGAFLTSMLAALFLLTTPCFAKARPDTVMEVLTANKELSIFTDYAKSTGLNEKLSKKGGRITVFAPTNEAMKKLPKNITNRINDNAADKKSLIAYHTVNGSIVFAANIKGRRASPGTGNGEMLGFDGTGKTLKVGNATITKSNLSAKNGVVHIIDGALVPPSFTKKKEELRPTVTIEAIKRPTAPLAPTAPTASPIGEIKGLEAKMPDMPTLETKKEPKTDKMGEDIKNMLKKMFSF